MMERWLRWRLAVWCSRCEGEKAWLGAFAENPFETPFRTESDVRRPHERRLAKAKFKIALIESRLPKRDAIASLPVAKVERSQLTVIK